MLGGDRIESLNEGGSVNVASRPSLMSRRGLTGLLPGYG
jgi:hypothetical protein